VPGPSLGKLLLAQAESEPYRKNTRIPIGLSITIRGQDRVGSAFEERTQTIDVSKKGIKTSTIHSLLVDSKINISNGHPHQALPARVAWLGQTGRPDDRSEIGVEFLGPHETGNIWTLDSPPADWVDGQVPLTAPQKMEYFWARSATLQKLPELQAMPGAAKAPSVQTAPVVREDALEVNSARSSESAINWEEILADEVEDFPVVESAAPKVQPASLDELIPTQAKQESSESIEESHRAPRIPKEAPINLGSAAPPDSPAAALNQLARILCEQAETITQGVDRAVSEVRSAAEESVAKLHFARQQIEVQLAATDQKHLAAINAESADALQKQSEALLEEFRKQLQREAEAQIGAVIAENQKQLAALVVASVKQINDVATSSKDLFARHLAELKERNTELQYQNEEYMRTSQMKVREEIAAAKSAVAPRPILWILGMLMIATIALFSFAYFSTQSVMRLRPDPPAEFVDPNANADHSEIEEQLAHAYWNSTVHNVQRSYKFGTILPEQPPSDFQIQPQDAFDVGSKLNLEATRNRYWQRLRKVWANPQVWEGSYEWNTDWIVSPLKSLGQFLRR